MIKKKINIMGAIKENKILHKIAFVQESYIELLASELDEVVLYAHQHGWKSTKYEAGKKAREQIKLLKSKL
jgi:hypothetical protein